MLARAVTHALVGLDPRRVEVEAHVQGGAVPAFAIVGLADRACQEAKERVRSGISSAELEWPKNKRITVNLAPAGLRKEGSGFDLPIALAILAATVQVPADALAEHAVVGELALDGRVRPVHGVLAVAEGARALGLERLLCPADSAQEAALAGIRPIPVGTSPRLWPTFTAIASPRICRDETVRRRGRLPTWPRSEARSAGGGRSS